MTEQNLENNRNSEQVEREIKKWNWGAFLLPFFGGFGNRCYNITLLSLLPCIGIFVSIYAGAYGNKWAWQNKKWESLEEFTKIQKRWATAGVILAILITIFVALGELADKGVI